VTFRAVLFDAGNTLLHLDYWRLAPVVSRAADAPITPEGLLAAAPAAARALESAATTDRERAVAYLESLFTLAGVPAPRMDAVRQAVWTLHRERNLWAGVAPDTIHGLERLAAAGVPMGVVSNSDGRVDGALESAGLRQFFRVVVDSALVGVEKPDPRIFAPALETLGVSPAEALYVGDLYEVDVVGARRAGMAAVLLAPDGAAVPDGVRVARSIGSLVDELLSGEVETR
jgi:putative hydrolase of the HAD superfamily